MTNKTLTDSIASLQAYNLKIIKLVKKTTAGTPEVEKPIKYDKPPWNPTGYFWSHGYNIHTGHNSATRTSRIPGYDTKEKTETPKEVPLGMSGGCLKFDGVHQQGTK